MFNRTKKERDIFGIIGLGRFGSALAIELASAGTDPVSYTHLDVYKRQTPDPARFDSLSLT